MGSQSITDLTKIMNVRIGVAYLGYGKHGMCHGRHFDGGPKIAWQKLKSYFTVS